MTRPVVLATRSSGLGDLCTAVPALRALRRAFPGHDLVVATPERLAPIAIAAGADEVVDTEDLDPLPDRFDGVDVAVNLHGSGPQSIERLLAIHPRRLITHRHPAVAASGSGPVWRADCHEVHRWCALLAHAGITTDPDEVGIDLPHVTPPDGATGSVVVHPGAAAAGRRWPAERFAAVVAHLSGRGLAITLTGSAAERDLCAAIAVAGRRSPGRVRDLAGRTDLDGLLATVSAARAVLANDTGVAHLAVALGTPSVALHGPTSPRRWGPPPGSSRHRALWKGLEGDPHSTDPHPGLALIEVSEVLDVLEDVMGRCAA